MHHILKKNTIIGISLFILVFSFIAIILIYNVKVDTSAIKLDYGWIVYKNDQLLESQPKDNIIKYVLPKMIKGDKINLTYKLSKYDISHPGIIFDTWHCVTEVYIDGKKLYSWGDKYYKNNHMLGAMRHKLTLPNDYEDKILNISLIATEKNAMTQFYSIIVSDLGDETNFWFNRSLLLIFSATIFLISGMIIFIFGYIMLLNHNKFISALMLGISFQLMGIYFLCRAHVIELIIPDPMIYNQIEFLSLYLLPLSVIIYSFNITEKTKSNKILVFYRFYILIYILGIISAIIIHNNTYIHYPNFLFLYYFITLISYLIAIVSLRKEDHSKIDIKLTILALQVFFVGSLLSLIAFHTKGFPVINETFKLWKTYDFILTISSFGMLILFFIGFYFTIKNSFILQFENEKLHYMAHYDALTMLRNKRSFDEQLHKLNTTNELTNYGFIVIDLNDLKVTNDSLGHKFGDEMIRGVANSLLKIPEDLAISYRIGGDEFAVIIYDSVNNKNIIKDFNESIDLYNKSIATFQISVALGSASKDEIPNSDSYSILDLADKRMYQRKQIMKSEHKDQILLFKESDIIGL